MICHLYQFYSVEWYRFALINRLLLPIDIYIYIKLFSPVYCTATYFYCMKNSKKLKHFHIYEAMKYTNAKEWYHI